MVCPVDDKGFCRRHNAVHEGKRLEFALLDNEFGEQYRRALDKVHGVHQRQPRQLKTMCRHLGEPTGERAFCPG